MSNSARPRQHLIAAGKLYDGAWRALDGMRQERGQSLPDWPDWCYLPMAASYAVVSGGGDSHVPPHMIGDVARLAALAAWRPTQGIYKFDITLYHALANTPVSGDLPCDVLHHLPEWCVYIETPEREWLGNTMYGFFAHLEFDANHEREELRLLLDTEGALTPLPIHLGPWPLSEAINRSLDVTRTHAAALGVTVPQGISKVQHDTVEPLVSLLMYLCARDPEIGDGLTQPARPIPKRTKHGWRIFPAKKVSTWDVGVRLGAALRQGYQKQQTEQIEIDPETGRARPRPHVRRAHWHTYRTGAGRMDSKLKWLPPIPVNIDSNELPAVVRPVK